MNIHSSASAPDSHRLPLFSPRQNGPQNHIQLTDKRKSHTGRPSAGVTDCSHILPSFHPFQGALRRSRMVGILTRTSQRTTPPALAPSLLRFYPNDQITPLRVQTFCAYSYGYSTGISPDSLISTSVNHRRVTPCSIYLLRNEFLCHTMYDAQEARRMYRFRQVIPLMKDTWIFPREATFFVSGQTRHMTAIALFTQCRIKCLRLPMLSVWRPWMGGHTFSAWSECWRGPGFPTGISRPCLPLCSG